MVRRFHLGCNVKVFDPSYGRTETAIATAFVYNFLVLLL